MKKLRKLICSFCCAVIAVAPFCGISAGAADTDGAFRTEFPGAVIPQQKNYTWQSVTSVKSIQKTRKYFIIKADFGGISEDLYISASFKSRTAPADLRAVTPLCLSRNRLRL